MKTNVKENRTTRLSPKTGNNEKTKPW